MGGCCTRCCSAIGHCCISTGHCFAACPKRCSPCCIAREEQEDETSKDAEKGEKVPELKKRELKKIESFYDNKVRHHDKRIVMYDPEMLSTWQVFRCFKGTIFQDMRIWQLVATQIAVTLLVAAVVCLCVASPKKLQTARFQTIGTFLKVLIAFMLGLFLNNALQRWWNIVVMIMELMLSVKKLVYILRTVDCEERKVEAIRRLGILAIYIFTAEVETTWATAEEFDEEWTEMFDKLRDDRLITEREVRELQEVPAGEGQSSRSSIVLTWIATHLLEIHKTKAVTPPVYARLMLNANDADDKIALAKVFSTVQMPFMYTHMLTVLVHANNLMGALTAGLTIGTSLGEIFEKSSELERNSPRRDIYTSIQMIAVSCILSTIQPAIYQAFLQIASTLCYPFGRHGEEWAKVPVTKLLEDLEEQLEWMDDAMDHDMEFQDKSKGSKSVDRKTTKSGKVGEDEEEDEEAGDD